MFGPCLTTSRTKTGHYDSGSEFWPFLANFLDQLIISPFMVPVSASCTLQVTTTRLLWAQDLQEVYSPVGSQKTLTAGKMDLFFLKNIDHPSVQASLTGGWAKRHLIWFQACRLEDPHACCPNVQPQQVTSRVVDL